MYLQEKGRIPSNFKKRFDNELEKGETGLVVVDLTVEVVRALSKVPREVVPELPDRIIAATALYLGLPLISRDRAIQRFDIEVIW